MSASPAIRYVRWTVQAVGEYGESMQASGSLDLAGDWIEPSKVLAVAIGAVAGVNDAAYESGVSTPYSEGKITLVIEYDPKLSIQAVVQPETGEPA